MKIIKAPVAGYQSLNEAEFELYGDVINAKFTVTYAWNGNEPVLTKVVRITNEGDETWNRLVADCNHRVYQRQDPVSFFK